MFLSIFTEHGWESPLRELWEYVKTTGKKRKGENQMQTLISIVETLIPITVGAFVGCMTFKVGKLLRKRKTLQRSEKSVEERRKDAKDVEKKQ